MTRPRNPPYSLYLPMAFGYVALGETDVTWALTGWRGWGCRMGLIRKVWGKERTPTKADAGIVCWGLLHGLASMRAGRSIAYSSSVRIRSSPWIASAFQSASASVMGSKNSSASGHNGEIALFGQSGDLDALFVAEDGGDDRERRRGVLGPVPASRFIDLDTRDAAAGEDGRGAGGIGTYRFT
uniref:Uncharacterized protein n=1 Tax=Candidatus Kentrum sp. TC TaxID=2126339 RepID=A0A451A0Z7_9GAMM|nr:MAG: hypothetical protein BECKTC1821F_GA0114240_103612 [Candidatus Kentron sp. TC]